MGPTHPNHSLVRLLVSKFLPTLTSPRTTYCKVLVDRSRRNEPRESVAAYLADAVGGAGVLPNVILESAGRVEGQPAQRTSTLGITVSTAVRQERRRRRKHLEKSAEADIEMTFLAFS